MSFHPVICRYCAAIGVALAVWCLRMLLVADLGFGIPIMDQWDQEALTLYRPWVEGSFSWELVVAPYLEHRIVWTNLWNLGWFVVCGQWDPMVQLVAQAALPALAAGFMVYGLLGVVGWPWRITVLAGALFAFANPLAHENILWGFQSSFGFFVLLSLGSIGALALAWSRPAFLWLVLGFGFLAPLAMGAGALAGPVVIMIAGVVALAERKVTRQTVCLLVAGGLTGLWGWGLRSSSPHTQYAYATSLSQFFECWTATCAWPNSRHSWLAALACLPLLLLLIRVVRRGGRPEPHELLILAMGFWAIGCAAGGAWTRGALGTVPPSRYTDFLGLLCWANALALAACWDCRMQNLRAPTVRRPRVSWLIGPVWFGAVFAGTSGLLTGFFVDERPMIAEINGYRLETYTLGSRREPSISGPGGGSAPVALKPHEAVLLVPSLDRYLPPEVQRPIPGMAPPDVYALSPPAVHRPWQWQSGIFTVGSVGMVVYTQGDRSRMRIAVLNLGRGTEEEFIPTGRRLGRWQEWLICAPSGPSRLRLDVVDPQEEDGLFLPRPLSAAGYWARRLCAQTGFISALGAVALVLILGGTVFLIRGNDAGRENFQTGSGLDAGKAPPAS